MAYSENEIKKFETFLEFHVGKDHKNMSPQQKISVLQSKTKRIRLLNIVNIVGAIFFAYWFWAGITQLSNVILYIIIAVFALNIFALNLQRRQLREVLAYLEEELE